MSALSRTIHFGTGKPEKQSKYRARKTVIDGITFASKKEGERYCQLRFLLRAGRIRNLERQKTYRLEIGGRLICSYRSDFEFEEWVAGEWVSVTEDVKGMITPIYRIKRKLMKALFNITIRET